MTTWTVEFQPHYEQNFRLPDLTVVKLLVEAARKKLDRNDITPDHVLEHFRPGFFPTRQPARNISNGTPLYDLRPANDELPAHQTMEEKLARDRILYSAGAVLLDVPDIKQHDSLDRVANLDDALFIEICQHAFENTTSTTHSLFMEPHQLTHPYLNEQFVCSVPGLTVIQRLNRTELIFEMVLPTTLQNGTKDVGLETIWVTRYSNGALDARRMNGAWALNIEKRFLYDPKVDPNWEQLPLKATLSKMNTLQQLLKVNSTYYQDFWATHVEPPATKPPPKTIEKLLAASFVPPRSQRSGPF